VATIDAELKMRVKKSGGSVLSVSNDKIILEPSKL
jgi:rRNA-processing protein FCF1